MRQLPKTLAMVGVAIALSTSSFVRGQVQKIEVPPAEPPAVKTGAIKKAVTVQKRQVQALDVMKIEVPALKVRAIGPGMKAAVIANVRGQQFAQQYRLLMQAEYHLVLTVCAPTKEQRRQIAQDGERAIKDVAAKYTEMQQQLLQGIPVGEKASASDPREVIQEALETSVKTHVSAEQAARYKEEVAKRTTHMRQVAASNLVERLDRDLALSAEQREKLTNALFSHWDDAWCPSLSIFISNNDRLFHNLPEHLVAPYLDATQIRVWKSSHLPRRILMNWNPGMLGVFAGDDPLEDEELREARLAEQAREEKEQKEQSKPPVAPEVMP